MVKNMFYAPSLETFNITYIIHRSQFEMQTNAMNAIELRKNHTPFNYKKKSKLSKKEHSPIR